jgi:hypothetical protein
MRVWLSVCRRQGHIFLFLLLAFFSLGACSKKPGEVSLALPATPPLSRPVIGYGVVNVSYTHLAEAPGEGSLSLGYLRRGSVIRILERRAVLAERNSELWVLVEGPSPQGRERGWLRESVVDIYGNEFQAHTAAESMTQ